MSTSYEAAFLAALEKLNTNQRAAVEAIEGPVMVIAGPGTGKTQILTLRIANILYRTDMQPENILALTFTDSGAKAMRERLRQYVGLLAYRVPMYTFHGFADRLISRYPDAFPRIIGGRAATDVEKVQLLEQILSNPVFKLLRPMGNQNYYVPALLSIIGHLKQEYVTPDTLASLINEQEQTLQGIEQVHTKGAHKGKVRSEYLNFEKTIAKNRELLQVYREYEALLRSEQIFDFDDMIVEAVRALGEDTDMLRDLQETYQYILADEHQDVNGAQNKILESLSSFHDSPNIFVVGDEKQAIYRFQGASLENFLYFTDAFPNTTQITLTENYRSQQGILDVAQALITVADKSLMALRTPLQAAQSGQAQVSVRQFSHQAVEDDWLLEAIKAELAKGVPAHEIAVIVRTNKEVEAMAARVRQAGIQVAPSADGDILEHRITGVVEALLRCVRIEANEAAVFSVLHGAYWGLSMDDVVRIAAKRSYDTSLMSILSNAELLETIGVKHIDAALRIPALFEEARAREVSEPPHRVLQFLIEASGLLLHVMTHDPHEGVRVLRRLYDEVEAMVVRDGASTLYEVEKVFALKRQYHLPLVAPYITTSQEAVQVMTAHKSKGLEFATVFVPHLQDSAWGGKSKRQLFKIPLHRYLAESADEANDDERRLLYVALTRAKSSLYLSYADQSILGKESIASRLLEDCAHAALSVVDTAEYEAKFNPTAVLTSVTKSPISSEWLRLMIAERGLSATSLNNLLGNPWNFFYRNVMRIPEIQPLHMQFGTVVHSVLERTTAAYTKHAAWPADAQIMSWLEQAIRRLPVNVDEYTRLHEKGLAVLFPYIDHLKHSALVATKEELSVRIILETDSTLVPQIPLSGKLDRIDLNEAGTAIRVVDYKTGKHRSRNAIEGKTESDDGGYKRQLVFYALLLSLYDDERYVTREGVLSFVESVSTKGVCKEESFSITDDEIATLKADIQSALETFISGDFLTDRDLAEASEYAHLALLTIDREI
jgi:DNA helicase II / ATP-dependent DNA helicase PcrA